MIAAFFLTFSRNSNVFFINIQNVLNIEENYHSFQGSNYDYSGGFLAVVDKCLTNLVIDLCYLFLVHKLFVNASKSMFLTS